MKQSLEASRHVSDDAAIHEDVMRRVLLFASDMDFDAPPPMAGAAIHRIIREITGDPDPYVEAKDRCNRMALDLYPALRTIVRESSDPLETALRLSIAGNIIDFAVDHQPTQSLVDRAISESLSAPVPGRVLEVLRKATAEARDILYLADNAGEIVFDRLLLELLPAERLTFVVKGSPVINDVVRADALFAGILQHCGIIDNGSDIPGTILDHCSAPFQERFRKADLIISKGQGNYESLSEIDREVFFLFKAKCRVIAKHLACKIGDLILIRHAGRGNRAREDAQALDAKGVEAKLRIEGKKANL